MSVRKLDSGGTSVDPMPDAAGRRADEPTAARVGEHDVRDVAVLAVIVPRPIRPSSREIEAQITAVLDLREHDPIALRRLSQQEHSAVVAVSDVRADHRAEVVSRNRARAVHGEASLERQLVAAEPPAERRGAGSAGRSVRGDCSGEGRGIRACTRRDRPPASRARATSGRLPSDGRRRARDSPAPTNRTTGRSDRCANRTSATAFRCGTRRRRPRDSRASPARR